MQSIARADFPQGSSTVVFLRPRPISLKNDAKPRYTFAQLPNDSTYEKHGLQNYAKRFVSIRSQKLYPVELQALLNFRFRFKTFDWIQKLSIFASKSKIATRKFEIPWVADGTRTRNNQNHNLGLYH